MGTERGTVRYALNHARVTIVRALLDAGADKDLATNGGVTPLLCAVLQGHEAVVRALLVAAPDKTAKYCGLTGGAPVWRVTLRRRPRLRTCLAEVHKHTFRPR